MNILFIKHFFCRIYGFRDNESIRIRALCVFGYFPLYIYIYILLVSLVYSSTPKIIQLYNFSLNNLLNNIPIYIYIYICIYYYQLHKLHITNGIPYTHVYRTLFEAYVKNCVHLLSIVLVLFGFHVYWPVATLVVDYSLGHYIQEYVSISRTCIEYCLFISFLYLSS